MAHFEVKIYHHKVASFKDVCMVVVMVLGDKAQNYFPSSLSPPIIVSSTVADTLEVCPAMGNFIFTKRTTKCVQVKVVTMDTIYKIIILAMLRIMHIT